MWDASNEYLQHMFSWRIKKKILSRYPLLSVAVANALKVAV